jgi:hypothetical protein
MRIRVSARLHATAAPDAPEPMMRPSTGLVFRRDRGGDVRGQPLQRLVARVRGPGFDRAESRDIAVDQRLPVRRGLGRRGKIRILQLHQRRFQRAPAEIDHGGAHAHQVAGDLRKPGDLLDEVLLVEPVRSRFRFELRECLRPAARPVARQPDTRNLVVASLVHRAFDESLEAAIHPWLDVPRLGIDARPFVVRRRPRDGFDEPDIVVVDVHQAGDDAAVLGPLPGIGVAVPVAPCLDRLAPAHVLHAERGDDAFELLGAGRVIVELRPARLAAGHEMAAVEIEHQRPCPRGARNFIVVRHDAEHAETAVLLDQRHRVGMRREQDVFVRGRSVVAPRKIGDEGAPSVALETRFQRQCRGLAGLRVREDFRAVDPVERQRRAVDVLRAETGLSVLRVDAPLRQSERRARREVVDHHHAGGARANGGRREAVELAPDPARMIRTRDVGRWRREQRRPLARRPPRVIGQCEIIEECVRIRRRRVCRRRHDENLAGDVRVRRLVRGVVQDHRRRDAIGRREAGRHPVRREDRDRRAVADEAEHARRCAVHVRVAVRPVVDDVMVVRNVDMIEIDGAEFRHAGEQEVGVALPAHAAGVGRAAGRLELVPLPRLIGCDQVAFFDR